MRDFDKSFKRTQRIIYGIWIFMAILIIAEIVAAIVFGQALASNPEAVGEFFGKIVKGFNQAK